ncbi:hypothetical protein SDC9_52977 [bioreactor metagenome]|uniref:Uncharacterized protein n=1 Tax=bioreactor metagenome TaxID=1076179 RepID=A0A644WS06_9ZZZZ
MGLLAQPERSGLDDLHQVFAWVISELHVRRNPHLPVEEGEKLLHPVEEMLRPAGKLLEGKADLFPGLDAGTVTGHGREVPPVVVGAVDLGIIGETAVVGENVLPDALYVHRHKGFLFPVYHLEMLLGVAHDVEGVLSLRPEARQGQGEGPGVSPLRACSAHAEHKADDPVL